MHTHHAYLTPEFALDYRNLAACLSEVLDRKIDRLLSGREEPEMETEEHEVYEHYVGEDRLARNLEERGELIVDDFHGLTVWCRAATGQAIALDEVICDIWDDLTARKGRNTAWQKH